MMREVWVLVIIASFIPDGYKAAYQEHQVTSHNHFHKKTPHSHYHQNIEDLFAETTTPLPKPFNQTIKPPTTKREAYSNWSPWSRCQNCIQRRMKICTSDSCGDSRIYEERPCIKKRCKRKARNKEKFHVVHLNETSNYLVKQGPSDIWTRWSDWSPCLRNCRTYRYRRCRKSKICNREVQKEEALCYHEESNCELFVLELLESTNRVSDNRRYHYESNNQNNTVSNSKKPHSRVKRCGIPFRKTKMLKIIGGTEAKRYKWPWHVAIINQHMEVFCGGTLISPRWVLTANHCIRKYLRVRLNAHDLRSSDGSDIEMTVYKIFPHPKFDYKTVDNDIALLLLPRPVKTPVACLPNKKPRPRQLCSVMGWGKVDPEDMYGIPVLREAKLPIVQSKTCRRSYKQFLISENMLCAGWTSGRADTCAGDSGGGLMCPSKRNSKTIYSVQGITSFGDGCGRRNKYGIYTNVVNFIEWINYIMDHYS